MRKALIAGNWKMNGSKAQAQALVQDLLAGYQSHDQVELAVCPPAVYLSQVQQLLSDTAIVLGAQNVNEHEQGAYTGEISVAMLLEFGCQYVILGHSERRALYAETEQRIVAKFKRAKKAGLKPVLCIGETLEQRESGAALSVIAAQVDAVLCQGIELFTDAVIAYEPVWAIGTGKTATPQQAQHIHQAIRAQIAQVDARVAEQLPIIYGGSVNPENAAELFAMADIDGALVGGASLQAKDFLDIYRAAIH